MPELSEYSRIDQALLAVAAEVFSQRPNLCWLLGGSCTGKSTVSRMIHETTGVDILDMDSLIYGDFINYYTAERHPAAKRMFGAANPLDWALSLSWEEFDALNRAADAEFLDLLAVEMTKRPAEEAWLIEGGFTHASVLTQVVPIADVVCLAASDDIRFRSWETDKDRLAMKRWVKDLPDGETKWRKFLYFDKMIAETLVGESRAVGIPVVNRREDDSAEALAEQVLLALVSGAQA